MKSMNCIRTQSRRKAAVDESELYFFQLVVSCLPLILLIIIFNTRLYCTVYCLVNNEICRMTKLESYLIELKKSRFQAFLSVSSR